MTTTQYITFLLKRTGNTVSRVDMLELVNIAQNEIASVDAYFWKQKPNPFLSTTDATYTYTLSAGVRRIARVYGLATNQNFSINFTSYGGFGATTDYHAPKSVNVNGTPETDVPVETVESVDPTTGDAQVIFPTENNPGTTTDVYYMEQYNWPTQLTSESIDIDIPEGHRTKILYYKVLRLIEEQEYGNSLYNAEMEEKYMKEWLRFANRGARVDRLITLPRDV